MSQRPTSLPTHPPTCRHAVGRAAAGRRNDEAVCLRCGDVSAVYKALKLHHRRRRTSAGRRRQASSCSQGGWGGASQAGKSPAGQEQPGRHAASAPGGAAASPACTLHCRRTCPSGTRPANPINSNKALLVHQLIRKQSRTCLSGIRSARGAPAAAPHPCTQKQCRCRTECGPHACCAGSCSRAEQGQPRGRTQQAGQHMRQQGTAASQKPCSLAARFGPPPLNTHAAAGGTHKLLPNLLKITGKAAENYR